MDNSESNIDLTQILAALQHLQQENVNQPPPPAPVPPTLAMVALEPKINLLEKFDGTRLKFRGFVSQVRLIMQLHPRRYFDDTTHFNAFMVEFETVFGDNDKAKTLANKLRHLQQGTRLAIVYASEFRQLACDVNWGEAGLIDQFRCGLSDDVQDLLLTFADPSSFSEAITQAIRTSCGNSPRVGKQEHPVTIGAVRLDLTQHHLCKGSCFAVGPSPSFTQYVDIISLVDSGATSSFIDQTFVAQHNIPVVKKSTLIPVEVIDGRTIASGAITHKTTPLELCIGKHTKKIILNIISTPHHPIILAHNGAPLKNPTLRKTFCPVLPRTLWLRTQRGSEPIPVFSKPTPVKLPDKYKDFVDVFEKINADKLPANSPYDCPIDLEEGHSPPFGPIYGYRNRNSKPCVITLLKTLPRGSFSIPSLQPAP
ncbi:hypothetical protein BDL97_02G174900 [Sphagnum fallax]|nr:hypothetical protein BDL97_02G174900 [Sphagnum fallax]